ncbi:MAG TPA: GspH/FimT family pseudopilin [Vicinamibacterales bacterium]
MVSRDAANGFTMLELVIALAIAALIMTLALPSISRRPGRLELAETAHDIAAALRLTRSRAIAQNQPALFVADVEQGLYRPAGAGSSVRVPRGVRLSLYTTQEQAVGSEIGSIRFYPDGSSSGGGVALLNEGLRYEVLVNWLNGSVTIQERRDSIRR